MLQTVKNTVFLLVLAPAIVLLIMLDMAINPRDYPSNLRD